MQRRNSFCSDARNVRKLPMGGGGRFLRFVLSLVLLALRLGVEELHFLSGGHDPERYPRLADYQVALTGLEVEESLSLLLGKVVVGGSGGGGLTLVVAKDHVGGRERQDHPALVAPEELDRLLTYGAHPAVARPCRAPHSLGELRGHGIFEDR